MNHDPVDVLIIGAGASGAAVAWSLADTKMHILCLDQGGWMNFSEYPSHGRDWEARFFGDYSPSPNIRARPEDYPINEDNSPIKGRITATDVGAMAAFLVSPLAVAVTATTVYVDKGYHAMGKSVHERELVTLKPLLEG